MRAYHNIRKIKKCINCKSLDFGFTEYDCFPHCSIKHAKDIANGISKMQHKITREEAYRERVCNDFIYEKKIKNNPEFIFNIDTDSIEYQQYLNYADMFLNILEEDAKRAGIKVVRKGGKDTYFISKLINELFDILTNYSDKSVIVLIFLDKFNALSYYFNLGEVRNSDSEFTDLLGNAIYCNIDVVVTLKTPKNNGKWEVRSLGIKNGLITRISSTELKRNHSFDAKSGKTIENPTCYIFCEFK
jgi:hypothetical protein